MKPTCDVQSGCCDFAGSGSVSNEFILLIITYLPESLLTIGIGIGWYTRYMHYEYTALLSLGVVGLFIFTGNLALHYYFRMSFLDAVFYLWVGCLLGIIAFFDLTGPSRRNLENIMNLLFASSLISQTLVEVLVRCCIAGSCRRRHITGGRECFLGFALHELCQLLGFAVACLALGDSALILLCLLAAFVSTVLAVKMKSTFAILNTVFLVVSCEVYLFPDTHLSSNPFAMLIFCGRFWVPAILDVFFWFGRGSSRLERWMSYFLCGKFQKRLSIFVVFCVEVTFLAVLSSAIGSHKEWYVAVPLFGIAAMLWCLAHLIFFIMLGILINRLHHVRETGGEITSLLQIQQALAVRGLRYFSLIAQRLAFLAIFSTILVALCCWTTRTNYSHSLLVFCLSLELMFTELLHEFSVSLGGTCIGYAIVAPVATLRSDSGVTILPPNFIQEAGARSSKTIAAVCEFFAAHLIINFAADLKMGGVEPRELERKLKEFFSQTTAEGPKYDTYLLYYSGPVGAKGDWALTDNASVSIERLLDTWHESAASFNSRLLLICDSEHSNQWLKPVRRNPLHFLGIQTVSYNLSSLKSVAGPDRVIINIADEPLGTQVGDFTRFWVDYNSPSGGITAELSKAVEQQGGTMRAQYSVSRRWADFNFHWPSAEEITSYWLSYLPRITWPLFSAMIGLMNARLPLNCCDCLASCFRRYRLILFPPFELETGHGFKLLNG